MSTARDTALLDWLSSRIPIDSAGEDIQFDVIGGDEEPGKLTPNDRAFDLLLDDDNYIGRAAVGAA